VNIPLVDLKAQYRAIKPEIDAAIQRVVDNTAFILGDEVKAFEQDFSAYIGTEETVGVASGTGALRLALEAGGIGAGDEVITTTHTFIATGEAISQTGARPVFVDINPETYNIDPAQVEDAITPKTKAIIPVHLYGQPAPMEELAEIADRHGLLLIEDAAQAHGAEVKGARCGTFGHLACFSFYPGKNLGAYGDAGGVTGRDRDLLAKVRMLRNHGRTTKYSHDMIGWGERMDGLQGAVLRTKLPHLEDWTEARRRHAARYTELLADCGAILPSEGPGVRHVYHLYVIRVKNRDDVLAHLNSKGIGAGIHYPIPLHRQPAYVQQGYGEAVFPETEAVVDEIISLPLYPELTDEQINYVCDALKESLA